MKRSLLLAAVLSASAMVQAAEDSFPLPRLEKSPRHLEWVTVKHDNREVGCFVGYPERKDKAPAVLVIHEIFGLSNWARSVVDEFAEAGYVAIAPDILWGLGAKGGGTSELSASEISQKIGDVTRNHADQITADLNAAVDYIAKQPGCNGKVVVIGFCWGGGQSFRYAANNPNLKAAFVCYGTPPSAEDMAKIKAPVYGFYGGNDARVSGTVPKATEDMKAAGKTYMPVIYEGAGHGFMRTGDDPSDKTPANKTAHDAAWVVIKDVLGKL